MIDSPERRQTCLGHVFDQYQNLMQIARCIRTAAKQRGIARPRVLELSRYITNLNDYLPEAEVTRHPTHDEHEQPCLPSPVQVPFADGAFDVCFVTDAYEHIPIEQRSGLLREMLRTTEGLVLLGSPVKSDLVTRADRLVFDFIWGKYAHAFEPLRQHLDYGLEPLEDVVASLRSQGADRVLALPCNYVYRHLHQLLIFFDTQWQNPRRDLYESINRIYNEFLSPCDYREPCYRYLMVVATDPALDLGQIEETMKGPCATPASVARAEGALVELFRAVDSRLGDELAVRQKEFDQLRHELRKQEETITALHGRLHASAAEIEDQKAIIRRLREGPMWTAARTVYRVLRSWQARRRAA
jgi:hypothetical protein